MLLEQSADRVDLGSQLAAADQVRVYGEGVPQLPGQLRDKVRCPPTLRLSRPRRCCRRSGFPTIERGDPVAVGLQELGQRDRVAGGVLEVTHAFDLGQRGDLGRGEVSPVAAGML